MSNKYVKCSVFSSFSIFNCLFNHIVRNHVVTTTNDSKFKNKPGFKHAAEQITDGTTQLPWLCELKAADVLNLHHQMLPAQQSQSDVKKKLDAWLY